MVECQKSNKVTGNNQITKEGQKWSEMVMEAPHRFEYNAECFSLLANIKY